MLKEKEAAFLELLMAKQAEAPVGEEYDEFADIESEPAIDPGYEIKHKHSFYKGIDD